MKKIVLVLIMFLLFAGIVSASSINGEYNGKPIVKLKSNGVVLAVEDAPAVIMDSRTMVPISMLRQIGLGVEWNADEYSVDVTLPNEKNDSLDIPGLTREMKSYHVSRISYSSNGNGNNKITFYYDLSISNGDDLQTDKDLDRIFFGHIASEVTNIEVIDIDEVSIVANTQDALDFTTGIITKDQFWDRTTFDVPTGNASNSGSTLSTVEIAKLSDRVGYVQILDSYGNFVGQGSGFMIEGGIFITNNHVASGQKYNVNLNHQSYNPSDWYLFSNAYTDVFGVLLSSSYDSQGRTTGIIPDKYLDYTTVLPEVGEKVYAIGSPNGYDNTVSEGIVSSIRNINGVTYIQHTADTEPGSSGGVLLNKKGQAIGITTMGVTNTTQDFAVPMMYVQQELDKFN